MDVQQNLSSHSCEDETVKPSKVVENPIYLFGQFVSAISSDVLKDIRSRSEFSTFVRDLCVKVPSVAEYLAQEILNYSSNDSQPDAHASNEGGSSTNSKRSSKRRKQPDRTYRLPKSSRTQLDYSRDETGNPDPAVEGRSLVVDDLVTCQPGHNNVILQA